MSEALGEKIRIVELVEQINELGVVQFSLDFGRPASVQFSITKWDPSTNRVVAMDYAMGSRFLQDLKAIRQQLEVTLVESLAARRAVA